MASKKIQLVQNIKDADKMIADSSKIEVSSKNSNKISHVHSSSKNTSYGPVTHNKSKGVSSHVKEVALIIEGAMGAKDKSHAESQKLSPVSASYASGNLSPLSLHSVSEENSSATSYGGSSPRIPRRLVSPKYSDSNTPSYTMMPVMMTTATSVEEQLAAMNHKIDQLNKTIEEKDLQIASLMNKLENQNIEESDESKKHPPGFTPPNTEDDQNIPSSKKEAEQNSHMTSISSLSVQQLQEMITNTIREQYGGAPQSTLKYSKPYTKRIDDLNMPVGYLPPKFQQFDGKGNPKQHVAHFVETCNNAGTDGDFLVKQFVRSLKGNAFDWYTDLESESVDSWGQMEREFLNRFYSTRRTVSMVELTNTRQWKEEPVVDYINRWRSLSLDCKEQLSEVSAVEMCMQGMHWGLLYILQGVKPRTFEELATRAHDMEISIASHGDRTHHSLQQEEETEDEEEADESENTTIEESMAITALLVKRPTKVKQEKGNKQNQQDERQKQQPTLKKLAKKAYPFPDSDVSSILEYLLEKKVIKLPKCKRLNDMGCINDSRYCKYHQIISHPTEKCYTLKELILNLAQEGVILLGSEEETTSNYATSTLIPGANFKPFQSSSFKPIKVQNSQKGVNTF